MRTRLKPVPRKSEEEIAKKETEDVLGLDSEHLTEDASLDFYEKAEINETKNEFSDFDREEMSKQILSLRNEIESLKEENERLRLELSETKPVEGNANIQVCSEDVETLKNKNNFLTLKSSNLEIEIKRLNEVVKTQQSTIDSFNHVYTKSNYNTDFTVRGTNMNGYQDWR